MPDVHIDIHGGNNQILPNATEAVQNFYYREGETPPLKPDPLRQPSAEEPDEPIPPEAEAIFPYVKDEQTLRRYLKLIGQCETARDLAQVIVTLQEQEQKIPADEVLKERFIRKFLPLAPKGLKGMTAHNLYTHIVNLKAARPRGTGK